VWRGSDGVELCEAREALVVEDQDGLDHRGPWGGRGTGGLGWGMPDQ